MSVGAPAETELTWTPRRQVTLEQMRRRSQLVRILRMVFTAGAAVAIGVMAGPVVANAVSGLADGRRTFASSEIVTMVNPRFTGRDNAGDPYVITADEAQRRRAEEHVVDLKNPKLIDQLGTQITAPEGTYDRRAQTLDLYRDVRVRDQGGYNFQTTTARFYVTEGRVVGLEPLRGAGPLGDIRSDSYEITEDGDVITFTGNVQMVFEEAPQPEPAEDQIQATSEIEVSDGEDG